MFCWQSRSGDLFILHLKSTAFSSWYYFKIFNFNEINKCLILLLFWSCLISHGFGITESVLLTRLNWPTKKGPAHLDFTFSIIIRVYLLAKLKFDEIFQILCLNFLLDLQALFLNLVGSVKFSRNLQNIGNSLKFNMVKQTI